jgi:hypothetical protein
MGRPDFRYAALDVTACAAFFQESRMKCAGATKLHRKSGRRPTIAFAESLRRLRRHKRLIFFDFLVSKDLATTL